MLVHFFNPVLGEVDEFFVLIRPRSAPDCAGFVLFANPIKVE